MTKTYVNAVWFFVNLTLHFLRVYSQDKIQISPLELRVPPGKMSSFMCKSDFLLMDIKWIVNGTELEVLNITNFKTTYDDSKQTGSLEWNSIDSKFNSTTIQCQAFSLLHRLIVSEIALLLVQGSPGPVENFVVEFPGVNLDISWSPPFILALPTPGDSTILGYCIDIYAKELPCSTPTLVHTECPNVIMYNFSLFIPLMYQCSELNISVLAMNFKGNGTRNTRLEKCRRNIKGQCSPAKAPLNGVLGPYSSSLLEEGSLVGYSCNPGYIPSPLGYHAVCTTKETWDPDPAKVMCKFIPSCDSLTGGITPSNFTRLNNPSVAEVVISIGMACFVGGGVLACVVVILVARKLWTSGPVKPTRKDTSNEISPHSQERLDKSDLIKKSTDQSSIHELSNEINPHQMRHTLKNTIRKLKPLFSKRRPPLSNNTSDRKDISDQMPDIQSTWQEEPTPDKSKPGFSSGFYNQESINESSKNISAPSGRSPAGRSQVARDFYSPKM